MTIHHSLRWTYSSIQAYEVY